VFEASNRLASCTSVVTPRVVESGCIPELEGMLQGHRIVLVDTPGFDDTLMGDEEILILLSEWLATS
jgi:hypothetical protein